MDENLQFIMNYIKQLNDTVKEVLDRVDAMEDVLYKQILEPAKQLNDDFERGKRHDEFVSKHGEALGAFNDRLKAIEGDDFDLVEQTFDDYDKSDKSISEDEYVGALIAKVQSQLDKISKAFGGGNIEVEAKDEDKDGKSEELTVETDTDKNGEGDKTVAAAVNAEETKENGEDPEKKAEEAAEEIKSDEKASEEKSEEKASEEKTEEEEEEVDSPEEIEELKKELEEEYNQLYGKKE